MMQESSVCNYKKDYHCLSVQALECYYTPTNAVLESFKFDVINYEFSVNGSVLA